MCSRIFLIKLSWTLQQLTSHSFVFQRIQGRPFFLTFYVANAIVLHPTATAKAEDFLAKHVGELVTPPASLDRLEEIGPFREEVTESALALAVTVQAGDTDAEAAA